MSFLKFYKAAYQRDKQEFINRCALLKHLNANSLERLMTLSKIDLKSVSAALSLPCRHNISKDDIIKNISNVILDVHRDTAGGVLKFNWWKKSDEGVI